VLDTLVFTGYSLLSIFPTTVTSSSTSLPCRQMLLPMTLLTF
jgi:hypothetical protein